MNGYKIVSADSIKDLEKQVNEYIQQHWRPIGGPFVSYVIATLDSNRAKYNQAIVNE